jgi:dolichol-phosphate mannosyltransferase
MPHLAKVLTCISKNWSGDIVAIDDNSTDGSLEVLKDFAGISVLHNIDNAGAGGVLLRGFDYAASRGFTNVITMDADGQHSPKCISTFLLELEKCRCCCDCDFVWGSRYLEGSGEVPHAFEARQQVNREITHRLSEVTGYKLSDAFCGFRAYRVESLKRLDITETGYGMFLQMTILAARAGMSIREIPVPLIYLDETRDFNGNFNDLQERLHYYHQVIDNELARAEKK